MAFEDLYSGVDYTLPLRAQQARQQQVQQAIGQGLAAYERAQDRDMRNRQLDMRQQAMDAKGPNLKAMGQQAIYQQLIAQGNTPEQAAAKLYSAERATAPVRNQYGDIIGAGTSPIDQLGLGGAFGAPGGAPQRPVAQPERMGIPMPPTDAPMIDGMAVAPMQQTDVEAALGGAPAMITPLPPSMAGTRMGEAEQFKEKKEISKEQRAFERAKALKAFDIEAKSSIEAKKKNEGRVEFERKLGSVLKDLDALKEQGGAISQDQSTIGRVGAMMAETPLVGQPVQAIFDPETQTLRDKIEGSRPALFNSIKKASGLTGGELNSQFEVENQLKQLGNPSMTFEARKALLQDLSNTFGTGELSSKSARPKLTPEQAREILRQRGKL